MKYLFDPNLLTDGYEDYQLLLNMYWYNTVNLPVSEQVDLGRVEKNIAPLMADAIIQKGDYPEAIREFLLAFNFRHWLADKGITPETDSVFADFKKTYHNSIYLPVLTKGYNEWLAIAPGNPAPDFEGYTREGKKVSIKDLKGKVVYIDAWATWCVSCVGEIPASKKLQQEFAEVENIQFLNVSVDTNKSDWENFLNDDKSWGGLHIILEPEKIDSFYTTYKLFGVPGFILIDQSGNIVNMKAPHPSDEKLSMEIKKLLEKEI